MKGSSIRIGAGQFDFARRSYVMGILNVTPDSFSDGGRFHHFEAAVEHALDMERQGADIIDIGGESTRPGSDRVSAEEELGRVIPLIETLHEKLGVPISIDTTKAAVAGAALKAGAAMVNDISGMTFDPGMIGVVAETGVPVVVMHTADDPKVMQKTYHYEDVIEDIYRYFAGLIQNAVGRGIDAGRIILDPGIGFGKSVAQNLRLIRELGRFAELGNPLLVGPSHKSFIGAVLDLPVEDRLEGSLAAAAAAVLAGANIVRVHDVRPTVRVCRMCDAILDRPDEE